MKHVLLVLLLLAFRSPSAAQTSTSQTTEEQPRFFAQCMLHIDDQQTMKNLEQTLRNHPYVAVARLDWNSKRAFILTKDLDTLTEEQFLSWLGIHANHASCIQIGRHGVDPVNPFPFTNCNHE